MKLKMLIAVLGLAVGAVLFWRSLPNSAQQAQPIKNSTVVTGVKLSEQELQSFQARIRNCWKEQNAADANSMTAIDVRLDLKSDGSLAREPLPLFYVTSESDMRLKERVIDALKSCAPYSMLPAAKFPGWKVLVVDLNGKD
jgi:hypothetical protein